MASDLEDGIFMLSISVIKGRYFMREADNTPSSQRGLEVEVKFNGETKATPAIDYSTTPVWDAEMVWELRGRALQTLKAQRTPIRVQCYSVDRTTGHKELLGYIVFPIRGIAVSDTPKEEWLPLLQPKHGQHPELLIATRLALKNSATTNAAAHPRAKAGASRPATSQPPVADTPAPNLPNTQPSTANEAASTADGSPMIFKVGEGKTPFLLSITFKMSPNLRHLKLPYHPRDYHEGFFLYFVLFGEPFRTRTFWELSNPPPNEGVIFDIRSSSAELAAYFAAHKPLEVFLCSGDTVLAVAAVPISELSQLEGDRKERASKEGTYMFHPVNTQGEVTFASTRNVRDDMNAANDDSVATLSVGLSLSSVEELEKLKLLMDTSQFSEPPQPGPKPAIIGGPVDIRSAPEYLAAWELELWKQAEREKFRAELKEKRAELLASLEAEVARSERERQAALSRYQAEYAMLDSQLKQKLLLVERHEQKLKLQEDELRRRSDELEREFQRRVAAAEETARRAQAEAVAHADAERSRSKELDADRRELQRRLAAAEQRYAALQEEFAQYKAKQAETPLAAVQAELAAALSAKSEVEKKLEGALRVKQGYKALLARARKENAELKRQLEESAREAVRRKQQEVEALRLRYLAREHSEMLAGEKSKLEEIKRELHELKEMKWVGNSNGGTAPAGIQPGGGSVPITSVPYVAPAMYYTVPPFAPSSIAPVGNLSLSNIATSTTSPAMPAVGGEFGELQRMREERENLLQTGMYSTQDKIVQQLDKRINALAAKLAQE